MAGGTEDSDLEAKTDNFKAMSAIVNSSGPYGVKAIRSMKAKNTTSLQPVPSSKLMRRKEQTYSYFLEKVDPILGECITYLLLEQPPEIPVAMIKFLRMWKEPSSVVKPESLPSLKPKKEMKLFLATSISPVISKLANRIAVKLPEDTVGFMIEELERMSTEDSLIPDPKSAPEVTAAAAAEGDTTSGHKVLQIAVLGLGGAGKTSIVNLLQGKYDPKVKPTVGFRPLTMKLDEQTTIKLYDLGGGKKIRDIWDQYYHDVHGIVYVIDATESTDSASENVKVFQETLSNPFLKGKPLLIFANKQDRVGEAKSAAQWQEVLPIPEEYQDKLFIAESSAFVPENIAEDEAVRNAFQPDPNLDSAIELLCRTMIGEYPTLAKRVTIDCAEKLQKEARKRIERERKVLRSKIATAFCEHIPEDLRVSLQIEPDPGNIFGENEGLTFLAAEIGEEVEHMSPIAVQVAKLTGYQRLALQIVGALKSPITKKKTPMTWMEILTLVLELRAELHLPPPAHDDEEFKAATSGNH